MSLLVHDNQFLSYAAALVDGAKSIIYVSTFKAEMTSKPRGAHLLRFFEKIKSRAKERVRVWILLNWHDNLQGVPKTNLFVARELKNAGVEVRHLKNNRCCHAKIILVDREKAIIGSHNLSVKSCHNNFEVSTIIEDPTSVAKLADVFEYSYQAAQRW